MAVNRLRAIRTAGRELTEEEENALPGCPWAVNSQTANYCFFKYIQEFAGDTMPSDVEVASLNCLSIETVKKIERDALNKIRGMEQFQNLRRDLDGESAFEAHNSEGDFEVHN
jgi:DNA-directed RNA polymerase sigma subunit (sigma70/sigma32)